MANNNILPAQSVNVTNLDFADIKDSLISYFKANDGVFKDWDYTGSGLNILMDVLAHNTHYNAVIAHMAVNESFIDSAQLRQNVVSAAKLIGYTPRSTSAPKAVVNILITSSDNGLNEYVIPANTAFSSNFAIPRQAQNYTFVNLTDIICRRNNTTGLLEAKNVELYQGSIQTRRSQINSNLSNNEYIIADKNIDTSTLKVNEQQAGRTDISEVYTIFSDINDVNGLTPIYFLYENFNGNYVITFGNGVFGKKPDNLNILELQYLISDGEAANGANIFKYSGVNSNNSISAITLQTVSAAVGGTSSESLSSIKYNAPLQYVAQNRAVTADDYKTLLRSAFGFRAVSVWGGEENDPPQYGKVFVSVKKSAEDDDSDLSALERAEVLQYLSGKKVLAIMPELVNPEYIELVLDVLFKYNPNLTTLTKTQLEGIVTNGIITFSDTELESFDGVFRHSQLTRAVDGISPAILNSLIRVYVSKSFALSATQTLIPQPQSIIVRYGTALTIDDGFGIVNSTSWVAGGVTYYMGDRAHPTDSNLRILYSYTFDSNNIQRLGDADIGTLTLSDGVLTVKPLTVDADTTVTIDLIPRSNDIAPKRNQVIRIGTSRLNVYGEADTIATGGSNRAIDYNTFNRDR
jgi:hypothetical protein